MAAHEPPVMTLIFYKLVKLTSLSINMKKEAC